MTKRVSYSGDLCTVKWIGKIPQWSVEALGVEWDNASRGKNDGCLAGVSYFTCKVKGAGSFVKATRKQDERVTMGEAVKNRYMENPEWYGTAISEHKKAEFVGADKIMERRRHVDRLETISVHHSCVYSMQAQELNFVSLRRLDLSDNLLEDLSDICEFLQHLNVESLNLSGNRFSVTNLISVKSLKDLQLSRTLLSPDEISQVLKCFPSISSLSLVHNLLKNLPALPELKELDLSYNILGESFMNQRTQALNFSHNELEQLTSPVVVQSLVLSCALPWSSFEYLGKCIVLRVGNLPEDRPFIIARLPRLQNLNGTYIGAKEREDSERYTLAAVVQKRHPPLPEDRWDQLVALHGQPPVPPEGSIRSQLLSVNVDGDHYRIVGHAHVQRLVWLVSRRTNRPVRGLRLVSKGEVIDPFIEMRMIPSTNLSTIAS